MKVKSLLKQAHKLVLFIVTAAYGVASNERTFSQLKLIKSIVRTTMVNERLDSLMLLRCEKEICEQLDDTNLVKKWSCLKNRRMKNN